MRNKLFYISRILLVAYLIGLCFCCFWNFRSSIDFNIDWFGIPKDKVIHFLLFFPFPIICHIAFPRLRNTPVRMLRFGIIVFLAGAATGGGIEILQGLTGYRSCDLYDFVADCTGLAAASLLLLLHETFIRDWSRRIG